MAKQASVPPRIPELRKRKFSQTAPQTSNEAATRPESQPTDPKQVSQSSLFTQSQFALALSLQKSKPLELSTKEYIHQLRKRIKRGPEEQHRYIDTADFWKDQYSKLLLEKNAWELKAQSLASDERDSIQPVAFESSHDIAELNYKPVTCIALLRQTQVLVEQLTDVNIDTLTLSKSLQTTLLHMSRLISQICEPPGLLKPDEDVNMHCGEHAEEVIHTVSLTYRQCLRGFNHLCRDIPGRQNKNIIIHVLSKFFSETLGHIHKMCEASIEGSRSSDKARMTSRTTLIGSSSESKYDIINMSLSKLLVLMIANDELSYLFHLLQHTGGTLSEIVFREQVSVANTNGSGNRPDVTKTPDPGTQKKGQYLVYILTQAIKNNPKLARMLNDLPRHATRGKKAHIGDGQLSSDAKKRLQHTLLKGVFGGDEFKSALKEPSNPQKESNVVVSLDVEGLEQFSTEWFVESLWSLIGWDVLSEKK